MKKKLIFSILLFFLLSTYKPQKARFNQNFNITEIIVENNFIIEDGEIKKNLVSLYNTNLISLNSKKVKKNLLKLNFIESFQIKKIYPNKIRITIFEAKPIAVLQYKKKKYFFTKKQNLVDFKNVDNFENLPIVFGKGDDFKKLYNDLKNIRFPIYLVKKFYYFETGRWDLLTQDNKTIKLPTKNYLLSLKNFLKLSNEKNFEKYKIFDYRITDQVILK